MLADITGPAQEDRPLRFVTNGSISQDVKLHGIDGYFRGGRFWSADGADHWSVQEVKLWQYANPAASKVQAKGCHWDGCPHGEQCVHAQRALHAGG